MRAKAAPRAVLYFYYTARAKTAQRTMRLKYSSFSTIGHCNFVAVPSGRRGLSVCVLIQTVAFAVASILLFFQGKCNTIIVFRIKKALCTNPSVKIVHLVHAASGASRTASGASRAPFFCTIAKKETVCPVKAQRLLFWKFEPPRAVTPPELRGAECGADSPSAF